MNDTLVTAVPPLTDNLDDHSPEDTMATRYLCAGTLVDRLFCQMIIQKIHNNSRQRVAPSYGFDLVPVVRSAWRAWLLDTGQLLAMLTVLILGLLTGNQLSVLLVGCATLLCLLLRETAHEVRQLVTLQAKAMSERWGLHGRRRRRRAVDPDVGTRARRVKVLIAALTIVMVTPFIASYLLSVSVTATIRPAIVIGTALLTCAVAAGVVRQLLLIALARARTSRPKTLTRRERTIDEQQHHPCVIYHRPPHRNEDRDPLDLFTRTDTPSPFRGSGELVNRWLPPLTIQLLRPGEGSLEQREYSAPPFTAHQLVESLRTALRKLGSDPGTENLPRLRVRDRIYIAAADVPANTRLIRGGLGKLEIWRFVDNHQLTGHHFLETSVPIFDGELVATVLIRVSLKGRSLSLDVATCALTRTPERYHVIDRYGQRGAKAVVRSALRSVATVPVDVIRTWRVLTIPVVLGRAWWARRDRTVIPRHALRPTVAVREEIANAWENAQLDRTTIYDHMKIVEQRILKATEDFLREHGVDTSVFESKATNIINSGVLNMGGSQMTVEQLAAGVGAHINNSRPGNGTQGAST